MTLLTVAQAFIIPNNHTHQWVIGTFDERRISAFDLRSITKSGDTFVIVQRTFGPRIEGKQLEYTTQYFFEVNCARGTYRIAGGNVQRSSGHWTTPSDYGDAFEPLPGGRTVADHAYRIVCEVERDHGRDFNDFSQVIATHRMLVDGSHTTLPW